MKLFDLFKSFFQSSQSHPEIRSGDIYAIRQGGKGYQLLKVLDVDIEFGGIHLYFYRGAHAEVPAAAEVEELIEKRNEGRTATTFSEVLQEMANSDCYEIMHAPLSLKGFLADRPLFITHSDIKEEELEGYRYYLEEMGVSE
ncbi:MAG: hypothetical protein AAF696_22180 [Bacteroidota bacterium]